MEKESFNLFYYLRILNKWKRWILLPAILAASFVLVKGFLSPRPYTAEATILLSGEGFTMRGGGTLGNLFPDFSMGNPNTETVSAMIHSRKMAEDIVDHFQLMEKGYGKNKPLLVRKMQGMVRSQVLMKNSIAIRVTAEDPQFSSDVANFCVSNLNTINEELDLTTDKPIVKVLDPAIPPIFPSSRKIIPRASLAFFVWVAGSTVFVFLKEYLQELLRREEEQQMFSVGIPDKDKEQIFS